MLNDIVWDRMYKAVYDTLFISCFSVRVIFVLELCIGLALYLTY